MLPAEAGNLSRKEKLALPKARKGIGVACNLTAAEMEKPDNNLNVAGVDPAALRTVGDMAERMDEIIADVEVALETLKQGNLIRDAEAFTMLRKVNDQVKAQAPYEPAIATRFTAVTEYFSSARPPPDLIRCHSDRSNTSSPRSR